MSYLGVVAGVHDPRRKVLVVAHVIRAGRDHDAQRQRQRVVRPVHGFDVVQQRVVSGCKHRVRRLRRRGEVVAAKQHDDCVRDLHSVRCTTPVVRPERPPRVSNSYTHHTTGDTYPAGKVPSVARVIRDGALPQLGHARSAGAVEVSNDALAGPRGDVPLHRHSAGLCSQPWGHTILADQNPTHKRM